MHILGTCHLNPRTPHRVRQQVGGQPGSRGGADPPLLHVPRHRGRAARVLAARPSKCLLVAGRMPQDTAVKWKQQHQLHHTQTGGVKINTPGILIFLCSSWISTGQSPALSRLLTWAKLSGNLSGIESRIKCKCNWVRPHLETFQKSKTTLVVCLPQLTNHNHIDQLGSKNQILTSFDINFNFFQAVEVVRYRLGQWSHRELDTDRYRSARDKVGDKIPAGAWEGCGGVWMKVWWHHKRQARPYHLTK